MTVRKATLEEWFLAYQLNAIRKRHFHLPVSLNVDISAIARRYKDSNKRLPVTAVLIKAAAMAAARYPMMNRAVFQTFYGLRIIDFDAIAVNVPILLDCNGRKHLSALVVRDAHEKTIDAIKNELKAAKNRDMKSLPVGRFFVKNKNTLLNRLQLKLIHFLVYNFPALYESKGGGGIAVSSLLNTHDDTVQARMFAYGPTAFVICAADMREDSEGKTWLRLGLGYDHFAFPGVEALEGIQVFTKILQSTEEETLAEFGP